MSDACNSVDDLPLDDSVTNKEIHDWLDKVGQIFCPWGKNNIQPVLLGAQLSLLF